MAGNNERHFFEGEREGLREIYGREFPTKFESSLDFMDDFEGLLKNVVKVKDERLIFGLCAAVEEMMTNAVLHGNLKLTKTGHHDTLAQEIAVAEQLPEMLAKRVYAAVYMNGNEVVVAIQDQGKDSSEFWKMPRPDPVDEGLLNADGRGEKIVTGDTQLGLRWFDPPEYEKNEIGVKVILRRKFTEGEISSG